MAQLVKDFTLDLEEQEGENDLEEPRVQGRKVPEAVWRRREMDKELGIVRCGR